MILAVFDLQVALIIPTKFQVNRPFGSEDAHNRFSRWQPSWIKNWNDLAIFLSTGHPDASYQVPVNQRQFT